MQLSEGYQPKLSRTEKRMVKKQLDSVIILGYFLIIFTLIFIIYKNNLIWLWSKWMEETRYSHGPFIPLISVYIAYQKKNLLKNITFTSANWGILLLFLSGIIFIVALRAQISFIQTYSMILFFLGIVWFIFGKNAIKHLWFPLLYLVFMVPFWAGGINRFSNFLKMVSSALSAKFLLFLGFPIFRDGVTLHLSHNSLEVADPCSGIQSLISLAAMAVIIAYYSDGRILKRSLILFLVIPLVCIGNAARILILAFFLEATGSMVSDPMHTLIGMVIFVLTISFLFGFNKWINI